MLKLIISTMSIVLCSVTVHAQDLKKEISEYDAKLVNYLISKKILVRSADSANFKLNQKTDVYSSIMSNVQVERSTNSDNCGGNGTGGL